MPLNNTIVLLNGLLRYYLIGSFKHPVCSKAQAVQTGVNKSNTTKSILEYFSIDIILAIPSLKATMQHKYAVPHRPLLAAETKTKNILSFKS